MSFHTPPIVSNAPVNWKVLEETSLLSVPRSRYVLFLSLATIGCLADLLSKWWVFARLGSPTGDRADIYWVWEGFFGFQTACNPGALFGMGQGNGLLFAGLSVIAAVGIVYWLFVRKAAVDLWLTNALGLVTGGIFGNLYDRLGFGYQEGWPLIWKSAVRDWILFEYQGHPWPNFNIADSLLVCGAAMLVWHSFRYRDPAAN